MGARRYTKADVAAAIQVEKQTGVRPKTIREGGRGGYTSREADRLRRPENIQEGGRRGGYTSREAGDPRQYRRAEVEAAIQVEKQTRGSGSRDNTGGRK